jgi:adenosylcobyric acid synthase
MKRFKFQIMVLGTSSHAGKSMLAAALCRIVNDRGLRVAPFKAQNMALNSGPTLDGGEIGRAQLLQAEAARCLPYREMNPVLLKPMRGQGSQVIVMGRPKGLMSTAEYFRFWPKAALGARKAYQALREMFEALVIEGAGSPAEVNLAHRDLANLECARFSAAPWILVCDIERGGAFASVVGTLDLVPAWLRRRCVGVVFNKFRGDASLLDSGIRWLKKRGIPTLGVLPYLAELGLDEEDSLGLPVPRPRRRGGAGRPLRVEIVQPDSIANFNDVQPLVSDPALDLRWRKPGAKGAEDADLVVVPGSKFTLADMETFNRSGESARLRRQAAKGAWVFGICGGLQMLGNDIDDALGIDGRKGWKVRGLGLLDSATTMHPRKISEQCRARALTPFGSFDLEGYEMHHGRTTLGPGARETLARPLAERPLMASNDNGRIWGTYMHAVLDNDAFRRALLRRVARDRGRSYSAKLRSVAAEKEAALSRWAAHVDAHLRLDLIPGFPKPGRG